ncbi:MAG: DNA alkylation repair protein [Candidatus Syntrophosphaera sp.]|jgi:3-methyladenine DNA glycosylase AlkD|nr:DNA alkylation repair protein [Candidatus Syntrophosphaera sp.]
MTLLLARTQLTPRQAEIFNYCESYFFAHENPSLVYKNSRYNMEGYDAFGLDEYQIKELRNHILSTFQPSVTELAELAYPFFATGKYEFGTLAIFLLKKHSSLFNRRVYEEMKHCLDEVVENWTHSDLIATKITPVLLELEIASMDDFASWLNSESKWTRRVAVVTMLYQKEHLPVQEILDFIRPIMQDKARCVQQGIGWLLRELSESYPQEIADFITQNKDSADPIIIQYATGKNYKDRKNNIHRPYIKKGYKSRSNYNKKKRHKEPNNE